MGKPIDLTGERFGRLVVIKIARLDERNRRYWLCKCDCGNSKVVSSVNLRGGITVSCGCRRKETLQEFTEMVTKHKQRYTGTYSSWRNMKRRCTDKSHSLYENYGGRGISFCKDWDNFDNFYKDMGDRPEGTSLERIDNNGNYSKENCKWATKEEQSNNKRTTVLVEFKGKTQSISQWSNELGISRSTLNYRFKHWEIEKALTDKVRKQNKRCS